MQSRILYLITIALLLFAQPACTQPRQPQQAGNSPKKNTTLRGRSVKIIDGDTFDLLTDDQSVYRIRLHGIDCPERGQDYYKVCKTALGTFCEGKILKVIVRDKDRYKRLVGDVYEENGPWVNQQMVAGGYAWHYTHYDQDQRLEDAMIQARKSGKGLWSIPNPVQPWEWRKAKREKKAHPQEQ